MNAGLLNRIVTFQEKSVTRTETGAQKTEWEDLWTGKARVQFSSGSRREVNGEIVNMVTNKVTVRYRKIFSLDQRIVIDGQKYRIVSLDPRRKDMCQVFTVELINE